MTEFRPGRFELIPAVIKNLVIANALIYFAQNVFAHSPHFSIENTFALHDLRSVYFRPHQLVTHMFLHGSLEHIFFNMFALWMFGSILENLWGSKRFLIFYLLCGLGAAALHLVALYYDNLSSTDEATVGASGAIFGCLAAFGYLFPNSLIYVYFFIPVKAKWFVLIYGALELYLAIQNKALDNVAHWAHLGGALVGLLLVWSWNRRNRRDFY